MKNFLIIIGLFASIAIFGQAEHSIYFQDKETVLEHFRNETKGGKLDFEFKLKEDKAPFYRIGNILYNRKDFGILLWALAIKTCQKYSLKEAAMLCEEIKQRKLTKPEKKAFKKGFSMKLEL